MSVCANSQLGAYELKERSGTCTVLNFDYNFSVNLNKFKQIEDKLQSKQNVEQ